jgi:methyl coenzyme M reductase subunit C
MNPQSAASGNSASAASATASHISPPLCEVTMSNHASQTSIVPVTAASGASHWEPRNAAQAVAANDAVSAKSKPTQARS